MESKLGRTCQNPEVEVTEAIGGDQDVGLDQDWQLANEGQSHQQDCGEGGDCSLHQGAPNSPTSWEKASSLSQSLKQTLTKQENLDPFKDFPLDKKSQKTAEEGQSWPAPGHLHGCLLESTRGELKVNEMARFLCSLHKRFTSFNVAPLSQSTAVAGGATLIMDLINCSWERVSSLYFVNDFENPSQDVWEHTGELKANAAFTMRCRDF